MTEEERATLPVGTRVHFENKAFPTLSYDCVRLGPDQWDSHEAAEQEGSPPWSDAMVEADVILAEIPAPPRPCNRHNDCDKADVDARTRGRLAAEHCHDDTCEDCLGQ